MGFAEERQCVPSAAGAGMAELLPKPEITGGPGSKRGVAGAGPKRSVLKNLYACHFL
jgi:hypothetical protein